MDIKDTIAQLSAQRQRLDRAIEALQAVDSPAEPTPLPTRRATTRARRTPQTTAELLSNETVLKLLTPEGVPAQKIRSQVRGSEDQVLRALKRLEADGKAKRTGQRRSTRWHLAENWVDRREKP